MERLAKLEAWKQKQALERERKQKELEGANGARILLDEIDKRAANSPAVNSPSPSIQTEDDAAPVPYAGKFDPKAIAKKATSNSSGLTKLGTDIALPEITKASATLNSTHTSLKANNLVASEKSNSGKFLIILTLIYWLT